MTGLELKVYVYVLITARFQEPRAGTLTTSVRDLASELGANHSEVARALHRLAEPHGEKNVRYIKYSPGENQHVPSTITVCKYAVPKTRTPDGTPVGTPTRQQPDSDPTATPQHDPSDLGKQAPKNGKEGIEGKEGVNLQDLGDEDAPKEATRFMALLKVWEAATCGAASENDKRAIRTWAGMGYSDDALAEAVKLAIKNKAGGKAAYVTTILRNGPQDEERWMTPDGVDIRTLEKYDNA
jgi:hypothetical protein